MLSKLSKYVMGLLHKRPMNPYELIKLSDMEVIQSWFPMTATSLYATIRNLEKNGYVTGKSVQDGKFPAKTVYSLTDVGVGALLVELPNDLSSYEAEASNFGIALFHISSLKKEEALLCAGQRLEKLEEMLRLADEKYADCAGKIPFNMRMMLRYKQNRLQMEIQTTRELLDMIERDEKWDGSFARYLDV